MQRLGFTIPVVPMSVRDSCDFARKAEELGYTDAWSMESGGTDGLAVASAVGAVTERMRIGCAIIPAFTRPPSLLAMGAATAQQACAGRFCLGIGASSSTIVERWMGLDYDRPYTRVRETLDVLTAALSGEKVRYEGDTVRVEGFRLETAPAEVPIFLAALGPRMLSLARERDLGVALFLAAEESIAVTRAAVPDGEIVQRVICVPDRPQAEVRDFGRWLVAPYLAVPGYNRFLAAQGFEAEARAVADAWGRGDRKGALAAISDRLVDAVVVGGPIEAIVERIESLRAAGLDTPILMPLSQSPDAAIGALEALAP